MGGKNIKIFFFFFSVILLFFFLPASSPVFAFKSEVVFPGLGENPTLPQYISAIFNFVMRLAGGLAVLAVLFGSLRYLTSFGSPGAKSEGKQWIKSGILGLVLLMSSYLILYTINKDLVSLKITSLGIPILEVNIPEIPEEPKVSKLVYQEFPIGTLTENVLSRTSDYCYEFDLNGDPIDGKPSTADVYEPTITNRDRLDCALKIYEAAEKKAKIFSLLSEEIAKLMDTCNCSGNCDENCSKCDDYSGACPRRNSDVGTNTPCGGNCKNAPCKKNPSKNVCPDVCVKNDDILDISVSTDEGKKECVTNGGKIIGVKKIIEQGPIKISITCPECGEKTYKGLVEFKTSFKEISSALEKEITIDGKKTKVIKKDIWNVMTLVEQIMYFKEKVNKIKEELKLDLDVLKKAEDKMSTCYLVKSSIDFWKIAETNEKLKYGEIEIQKLFKDPTTNQNVDPSKYCKGYNYSDSSCFSFCRKMCFPTATPQKFSDPDSYKSFLALKNCDVNNFNCLKDAFYKCVDNSFDFKNMQECLAGCRTECSKSCDIKYPKCLIDKNKECKDICAVRLSEWLVSCRTRYPDLRTWCEETYKVYHLPRCIYKCDTNYPKCPDPDENKKCKDACNKDSEHILQQDEKCFGEKFRAAKNCADAYDTSDFESFKRCIESSTCSFCTDQYAGYPDCLKIITGDTSSLDFYKYPEITKCSYCYQNLENQKENEKCKKSCGDSTECSNLCDTKYPIYEGIEQYPECQKCPQCSICPQCPCKDGCSILCDTKEPKDPDKNKECKKTCSECVMSCDTKYPKDPDKNKDCKNICAPQNENCSQIEEKTLFCNAQCADFAYNQDPLTFYCWTKWWKEVESETGGTGGSDEEAIRDIKDADDITEKEKDELLKEEKLITTVYAETLYCQKGEEIPVGETVDGAEKWAEDIIKTIEDFIKKIDSISDPKGMIQYINQIGKETGYCECISKCSGSEPACKSDCIYAQAWSKETGWICFCGKILCNGNPCQKMINLLRGKKKGDKCPKDVEYKGVAWYQQEITKSFEEFKKIVLRGERSDLLKKLIYSRKKMQECGVVSNIFEKERKTISCTLMKDYLIEPISRWSVIINAKKFNNQCYGGWLSKILGGGLMDNWECCELWLKAIKASERGGIFGEGGWEGGL